jgi:hypothetical protein
MNSASCSAEKEYHVVLTDGNQQRPILHMAKYNFRYGNYTIIVPTKCTSLLKAQDITICTFLSLYS